MKAWQKQLNGDSVGLGQQLSAEPQWDPETGVPFCSEHCSHHDGKRCQLLGFRAPQICEVVVQEMARVIDKSGYAND